MPNMRSAGLEPRSHRLHALHLCTPPKPNLPPILGKKDNVSAFIFDVLFYFLIAIDLATISRLIQQTFLGFHPCLPFEFVRKLLQIRHFKYGLE